MLEHYSPLLLVWAFTYFVHSSILIGIAYISERAGFLTKTRNAELVWRVALFGALLTASTQVYLASHSEVRSASHNAPLLLDKNHGTSDAPPQQLSTISFPLPENLITETNTNQSSQSDRSTSLFADAESFKQTPLEISLPHTVRTTTSYFIYTWLLIAFIGCFAIYRSARHLNRLAAYFPEADKSALKRLLNRIEEREQSRIQLKVSDQWNSPFVTPDNTICIPRWAYIKLNDDQRDAMLAHEVAHVLRRDPAWRLAMQALNRICFFQPLHKVAIRKLELLAELACDERAAYASGKPQELAEALYTCARIAKAHNAPDLALAMSRQGSPLFKRISSLLDQDLLTRAAKPQSRPEQWAKFSVLAIALIAITYSTPSIRIQFEKALPSLTTAATTVQSFVEEIHHQAMSPHELPELKPIQAPELVVSQIPLPSEITEQSVESSKQLSVPNIQSTVEIPVENGLEFSIAEAQRLRDKREWQKARTVLQNLAENGNAEAQQALGEMYWRGQGVATNTQLASEWFKRASASGFSAADKYLTILNERENKLHEIAYYTEQYDGKDWNFNEMKCVRPEFSTTLNSSTDIEFMIYQINEFATCFNRYGERLNASKVSDRVLPNNVVRIMTDEEIEKALNRNIRVMATIRLTANLIAEDFMIEKQNWETRTREQFKGARSRDWMSLKRIALNAATDSEQNALRDTKLVKIDTSVELISNNLNFFQ
ncbi:M56 family metallopeptidase [Undibacterium cyanobacteriorum]|uniref:M56 family metallopeptidase n=1 Tax=Undibacterium cyanobacteriorum TaxID=3073561 RepID=A0ABY9RL39_9BURK|nr:M56 family metallopeptidase [Undibacterium sp. 20NA77.5]WMW81414.1 M56 family metallopeptidase [Undibacterium sp. 20NA77.5]